jgi:hypothetical protein
MARRPRSFEEVVAALSPAERTRIGRIETFTADQVEVNLAEDRDEPGEWRVEYFDEDGACYVTIFAGPRAEPRARAYFEALKSGQLNIICDDGPN